MKKFQKLIAIDFDGTITVSDNKCLGQDFKLRHGADVYINRLYDEGYLIAINTLRYQGKFKQEAIVFLEKHKIKYHFFNKNDPERVAYFGESRKIAGDIYVDDRGLMGIPEKWVDIYKQIKKVIGEPYNDEDLKLNRVTSETIVLDDLKKK